MVLPLAVVVLPLSTPSGSFVHRNYFSGTRIVSRSRISLWEVVLLFLFSKSIAKITLILINQRFFVIFFKFLSTNIDVWGNKCRENNVRARA